MIPPLRKVTSEDKNHRPKQESSDSSPRRYFSEILDEECVKEQQRQIHICTDGYTRRALPYHNLIMKREYCYPT